MSETRVKELNYNLILLLHINRIGKLCAAIMGETQLAGGQIIHSRTEDKDDAIKSSVNYLNAIIPQELRDDELESHLKNSQTPFDEFHSYINLLVRKGYLIDKYVTAEL